MKLKLILIVILTLLSAHTYANGKPNLFNLPVQQVVPVEQAFILHLTETEGTVHAQWDIAPGCYLYQDKLRIVLQNAEKTFSLISKEKLPPAKIIEDPAFGPQAIYQQTLQISLPLHTLLQKLQDANYALTVDYQGCNETGFCYPPINQTFTLSVAHHQIQSFTPSDETHITPPSSAAASKAGSHHSLSLTTVPDLEETEKEHHVFTAIATFYFLGILLTFTPCVLPMLPILFSIIVGQKHLNTRKAFRLSLCYVLSMAFTYACAGVIAATLGKNLQAQLQQPAIIITFALLFAFLGLVQLNVLRIHVPHSLRLKEILLKLHANQESGTYIGAAVMGILATLISSPCVTYPMIVALGYISQSGNIFLGGGALLAMGLGMGTILLIAGTLGGKYVPKSGPWMHSINQIFAIAMFGLCFWLLNRVFHSALFLLLWAGLSLFTAWCLGTFSHRAGWPARLGIFFVLYAGILVWGAWLGETNPLKPLAYNPWSGKAISGSSLLVFQTINSISALNTLQAQAQKQQQPVMVVFSADWCTACKHLEHDVLSDPLVQQKLSHWELIRADVTPYSEANQQLLRKFDLIGPPAILFFDKNGSELTNYRVIGESSASRFITQLDLIEQDLKRS